MTLARLTPLRILIELLVIILVAVHATEGLRNSDPQTVLIGLESQWLTNSAYITANTFHIEGSLPLWQPYLGHGEPVIDNPFSFVLNPLSTFPILIFGAENGIKYSVIVYMVFAGIGGWLLGYVLNLGWLGRLFLGLVCIGRGNIPAELGSGYYQLAVTQTYFQWVAAGIIAIIRYPTRRAPVVLLAVVLTLLFWAGNVYYTLPALIMVAGIALAFLFRREGRRLRIDPVLLRRVALALLLTVGLAAVTLIPIYVNQQYIGAHPDENPNTVYETPAVAAVQFFTSLKFYASGTWSQNYYSYVLPLWFALLILVIFPPIGRLNKAADPRLHPRLYAAGLLLILLFFSWATRTNPILTWAYEHLPLIGQWRTLSRMLTVCAFWIAVLVAMRLDGLWRAVVIERGWNGTAVRVMGKAANRLHLVLAALLIVASYIAVRDLLDNWNRFGYVDRKDLTTELCINWLRRTYPDAALSVYGNDYYQVSVYIGDRVRFSHINADYHPLGMSPSLYDYNLSESPSQYLIAFRPQDRSYWLAHGYTYLTDSPTLYDGSPCLMVKPDALPYAFSVPLETLQIAPYPLPIQMTTPITALRRETDHIGMIVNGDPVEPLVVAVQEIAWPGWNVTVDGAPAKLESVGQLIGVVIPQGTAPHRILFVYDPPLLKLGGLITLMTAAACAFYLLNGERRIMGRYVGLPLRMRDDQG